MRFRRKERGTRVKDCAKNGVSNRAGRGWGKIRRRVRWRTQVFKIEGFVCKRFLPSSPAPPTFIFLALVSFLARPKSRIPFHGLFLLRNQTETLTTQAKLNVNFTIGLIQPNNNETCFLKDYHISDPLWIYMYNTPYPGTVISTIPHTKC